MYQPYAILAAQLGHQLTPLDGRLNAPLEEGVVDHLLRVETPHPGTNLRSRAPRRSGQRPTVGGHDVDGIARPGTTAQAVDRRGEDPRVTVGKLAILARQKDELSHAGYPAPGFTTRSH